MTPPTPTVIAGQTQQLTAAANYSDGSTTNVTSTATWSSSNTAVATVSSGGLVTSVAAGQANISAVLSGVTGSDALTVDAKAITSIAVTPATVTLIAGQTQQLTATATATYNDGSTGDVTSTAAWSSSNIAIATVSASGLLTSVTAGQANISAAISGASGSDSVTVNAKVLTSISVSPVTASLNIGLLQQYGAIGTYNDGSTADVTQTALWSSSSTSTATISSQGLVTTVAQGSTNISATAGSIRGTAPLTVNSSAGGVVLVNDMTDSRILMATNSDQSTLTFLGTRDSNGNPTALYGVKRVAADGSWQSLSLDSQGRPTAIIMSDNTQFTLDWVSDTSAVLTGITSDGTATLATTLGSTIVPTTAASAVKKATAIAQVTPTPANSLVTVNVTTCGVPESLAQVTMITGDPNTISLQSTGSGTYQGSVASGTLTNIAGMIQNLPPPCSARSAVLSTA
ncbi:MAG: Ig-like domain-containing protein [Candidatus Acidiferrales bacterium]